MIETELPAGPHRRYNALTGEWLLVSAERTARPWRGQDEMPPALEVPAHDPGCFLCPGNTRAGGERNPDYESTFVFTNDFAALRPDTPAATFEDGVLRAAVERGTCEVICFSPRHDLSLSQMSAVQLRTIVNAWAAETSALGRRFEWVQVFENRGAAMGASSPHPHGQIWAGDALPREAVKEDATQRRHFEATGRRLLLDYAAQEAGGPRDLGGDGEWLAVVPFWASWPFETLLVPRRPVASLPELDDRARDSLAATLGRLLGGYYQLLEAPFPYSMGWHQAPFDGRPNEHLQLHGHLYPPLLRAAVRKYIAGYELFAETQRDLSAEEAAERLRTVSAVHYLSPAVPDAG